MFHNYNYLAKKNTQKYWKLLEMEEKNEISKTFRQTDRIKFKK
jgi:hypothetical protein